jgi:tetratricopeptide (TPR) repeat protein
MGAAFQNRKRLAWGAVLICMMPVRVLNGADLEERSLSGVFHGPLAEAPARGKSPVEQLLEEAAERMVEGKHREAMKPLLAALKQDSGNLQVYLLFAQAHMGLGEVDYAGNALNQALKLHPGAHQAWGLMAQVYLQKKEVELGLAALERAIALATDDPQWQYHYQLGRVLDFAGKMEAANVSFAAAIPLLKQRLASVNRSIRRAQEASSVTSMEHGTEVTTGWNLQEYAVLRFETQPGEVPDSLVNLRRALREKLAACEARVVIPKE